MAARAAGGGAAVGQVDVVGRQRDDDGERERQALEPVLSAARKARLELPPGSHWDPTLDLLETEIREGQPFFFRVSLA
jgi:hypothetical protein